MASQITAWLEKFVDSALSTSKPVTIPFEGVCSFHSARVQIYDIIRRRELKKVLKVTSTAPSLIKLVPITVPDVPNISSLAQQGFVNQIVTRTKPTMQLLSAYRVLLDAQVVMAVEIVGLNQEEFEKEFSNVKSFLTRNTRKGLLLL